jgi:hypothetical protein
MKRMYKEGSAYAVVNKRQHMMLIHIHWAVLGTSGIISSKDYLRKCTKKG